MRNVPFAPYKRQQQTQKANKRKCGDRQDPGTATIALCALAIQNPFRSHLKYFYNHFEALGTAHCDISSI